MSLGITNLNWHEHQKDPDNWIKIPEFNVKPQDVAFQGFAYSIYAPKLEDPVFRLSMWEMVKAIRSQARTRFKSLADLQNAHAVAFSRYPSFDAEYAAMDWSKDEIFAFRYILIFQSLETCIQNYTNDKSKSIRWLALAASNLASMMMEKPIGIAEMQGIRSKMATGGALARHANDPKQGYKAIVRQCWDDWQKQPFSPDGTRKYKSKAEFARDMRDKFPDLESQPVIERWCRAWERES